MKPKDYMQETLVFVQHLEFISGTCRAEKKAKILQAAPPHNKVNLDEAVWWQQQISMNTAT